MAYSRNTSGTTADGMLDALTAMTAQATPKGYVQITNLTAAVGLGTIPTGARYAVIQPEGQQVRWRDDGSSPAAGVGMQIPLGKELLYDGDLTALKFIQDAATAKLNVVFYA
jgi:hypothetical protein